MEVLLVHGADQDSRNGQGNSPLILAASDKRTDSVELLLRYGARVKVVNNKGEAAIFHAAGRDMIDLLDRYGVDLNSFSNEGLTPLINHAWKRRLHSLEALLDHGVPVDQIRPSNQVLATEGETALFLCRSAQCVKLLIDRGAHIHHRDAAGRTALAHHVQGQRASPLKALLDSGASIDATDRRGRTALFTASEEQYVEFLIRRGACVNHQDEDGWTALMEFSSWGRADCVATAVKLGASVNHISWRDGNTALCVAQTSEVIDVLLSHGADIEQRNKQGCTPLLIATSRGDWQTMSAFRERGSKVDVVSYHGENALQLAKRNEHEYTAKILERDCPELRQSLGPYEIVHSYRMTFGCL
ncbi:Putative ankyrin repeat-containing domain superfamily [Septoria linicola]|uniref:Ankyrin repeat-containing domain superfamily n=1 Tax=Septoria linicola TaxID=215465 RepID=A0A9Q9EJ36_9PEZI|nr:putative ankyrin repeat-containing domain superfamily [Septoria linicola]USW50958.1 Putative ankyrin repeat-containing domain superfamily [Septoria linicola]